MTSANPTVVTTGSAHGLVTGDRVAFRRSAYTTGPHGWYNVTVIDATRFSVPVQGSDAATLEVLRGVRISDAMRAVAGESAAITTGLGATWDANNIGLLHYGLNVRPHDTRAGAIDGFAMLHSAPIDYGFWEDDDFTCAVRSIRPTPNSYVINSSDPAIDYAVFKDVENSPAYVKVLYSRRDTTGTMPPGTVQSVYRPSAPIWEAAAGVVDIWDEFADVQMIETEAQSIGDQILSWIDHNQYVGTIRIATATVPLRAGGTKNTCYIRAGDDIEESNHAIGRLMITSVVFDPDSGAATLGIGETRRDFVRRIRPTPITDMPDRPRL